MTSAMESSADPTVENPPEAFADTLSALERIIQRMESGQLGLEESVTLFQQGMALAQRAEQQLREAKQKVEILLNGQAQSLSNDNEED